MRTDEEILKAWGVRRRQIVVYQDPKPANFKLNKVTVDLSVFMLQARAEERKLAREQMLNLLEGKFGSAALNGGAYGQLDSNTTEDTFFISKKDWELFKEEVELAER